MKIFWPKVVTNLELHRQAGIPSVASMIIARRWEWIGHILHGEPLDDKRIALSWSPPGKRSRQADRRNNNNNSNNKLLFTIIIN